MEPVERMKLAFTIIAVLVVVAMFVWVIIKSFEPDVIYNRHISANTAKRRAYKNEKKIKQKKKNHIYWSINDSVNNGYNSIVIDPLSFPDYVREELVSKGYTIKDRDEYDDVIISWGDTPNEDQG